MSTNESEIGIGAEAFAKGTWYHELLEDGLALSYRVRARENDGGGDERAESESSQRCANACAWSVALYD